MNQHEGSAQIDGYIAFLDILGFSELVRRQSFDAEFEQYSEIIGNAIQAHDGLNYVTFSDSIVINTGGKRADDLFGLLQAVAGIQYRLLVEMEVPVRGCISAGRFSRIECDNHDVMIAGSPIVDAVRYEEKQDWVGVMLSPTVLKADPGVTDRAALDKSVLQSDADSLKKRLPWVFLVQRHYCVPFHSSHDLVENQFDGFVVVPHLPPRSEPQEVLDDLAKYREKLDVLKIQAPGPSAQRKYQQASNWLSGIEKSYPKIFSTTWWDDSKKS